MGCASSKSVELPTSELNDAAGRNEKKNTIPNAVSAETKDEDEEAIVIFDARENHPTLAVLDDTRANDIVYVYLQSFRLRHQNGAREHKEGEEDKGPPQLREYVCELMIRKKAGGRGNREDDTNDYRDEWISLGTKEFCSGVSGSLVPYLPRVNSNKKNTNDATKNLASIMKPMNCAPVWPVPGAVELSTAFRVKVFPKDRVEKDVDIDVAKEKRDESERETAVAATTNTTVNPIIQDAKKTFLEESGRASPDLIKKRMDDSVDTEDEDEPMESLLVDPRLDEIFNENKKSDGSLGCVLFTLSTLLPPKNDRETAEKKANEDNNTSNSTPAAPPVAAPAAETTTHDSTKSTLGGRRDSGELIVLDSKVCYFDVGYRGVVSTLAAPKFTDCFENQGVVLDSMTCKTYCKEMKLNSKAIQAYTKGGFLSVLKLKKMLDTSSSPHVSPSGTPKRLSLDIFTRK